MEKNRPKRIFIVEDQLLYAESLKMMLESKGYEVALFSSGEEMISSWEEDPDLIMLDYFIVNDFGMNLMNGGQILRFIRRISKSLPVIMLTKNEDIGDATQLLKLGAIDFIPKDKDTAKVLPQVLEKIFKSLDQVFESFRLREEMNRNRAMVKKYRERFLIIALTVALAGMTLLWLLT